MKMGLAGLAVVATLAFPAAASATFDCEPNRARCLATNGGAACNDRQRMAVCQESGVWTGPSGRKYQAGGRVSRRLR
jgi:hypothetical protein